MIESVANPEMVDRVAETMACERIILDDQRRRFDDCAREINRATPCRAMGGIGLLAAHRFTSARAQTDLTPSEDRTIAKEAYVYGFPLVDGHYVRYLAMSHLG